MQNRYISILIISIGLFACANNNSKRDRYKYNAATKEDLIAANRVLVKKDRKRIEGFVERNNWEMKEAETGFWFEIIEQGIGQPALKGLVVKITYKISLLDGTLCYSSENLGPKVFEIGRGGVEPGLEQAILLCNEGTKARFILPPYLAYGLPGDGNKIPARSIILYELEVINISNKK